MDELALLPATAVARLVARREVTSRELVELQIRRVRRLDPGLGAVVLLDEEGALAAARAADAAVAAGRPLGPLHGVPMTVKDAFATAGMRTTSGDPGRADHVPAADAVAVARLRAAGCVVAGKTNVPSGVTGQETANPLFGRTSNPWDRSRTPGGSSGGAAAALAAGLTWLELGSDMGGSIRQPAHCCGVAGHVPSHGLVPHRGHLPSVPLHERDAEIDLMEVGPLARAPADLRAALLAIAGPDDDAAPAWRLELPPAPSGGLRGLRAAAWLDDPAAPCDAAVREVLEGAVDALADAGLAVDRRARPAATLEDAWRTAFALWVSGSSAGTSDEEMDGYRERARRLDPGDDSLAARRLRAEVMEHRDWLRADAARRAVGRAFAALFREVDVLLCPVIGVEAPEHDPDPDGIPSVEHRLARTITVDGRPRPYLDQLVWNTVVGMARLPSTVVPAGRTRRGMPVGLQVVGPITGDLLTLRVAELAAAVLGLPGPPPGCA
ncbi:amidase [Miltoncostaea marina]|uniref:amidase n=1 Tax=Miltoncostaea marina TaxID=2843215 RepID=UPI001C3C98D6|nr:amidase [Miltoncostaea marina]